MSKVIFFDFDGVIIDSMHIRDNGFRTIFRKHPKLAVESFMAYHQENAGLSRFHKIKYFYNTILKESVSEKQIEKYSAEFTLMMRKELVNTKYLISETLTFINNNKDKIMHIVSGSEQNELQYLCKELGIDKYFKFIYGSPTPKNLLVKNILETQKYQREECLLIGDSITDYNAAKTNKISFYGYNNKTLIHLGNYLESIKELKC